MRLVAFLSCLLMLGCFPNNAKHRTYAKYVEGGMLLGGVVLLGVANTGADCDDTVKLGMPKSECKSTASLISGIGLALVIGGLVGFMATVATTEEKKTTPTTDDKKDDKKTKTTPATPVVTPAPTPAPAPTP
jgi:hypothetical protein